MQKPTVGGWQRIGVVVTVLWVVCSPIYLMVDTNQHAAAFQRGCISTAYRIWFEGNVNPSDAERTAKLEQCRQSADYMTASKLSHEFLAFDSASAFLWLLLIVPIGAFWVAAGALLGTVRWIRKGFAES